MSSLCRACPLFLLHHHWIHDTLFYEPTCFSTATCGLCSVTSKNWCVDTGVPLRIEESVSQTTWKGHLVLGKKCTVQDCLRHAPPLFYLCFTSEPGCGHFLPICTPSWTLLQCVSNQSSVVTFFYLEFNGTSPLGGRATVSHRFCNEMLLYLGKMQISATETFVAIIKQTAVQVERKNITL